MMKVASYCRVSTDRDDQANSFESQQRYFKEYIDRQPDWELYQVYADEGITGTSTKKRAAFNRMIAEDPRVQNVILPLRDGLNLIRVNRTAHDKSAQND